MVLLKDFAEGRNVSAHTIATYIRRHPEAFEGHTGMEGNKLQLDEEAVAILNKVYPLPAPEEIWTPAAKEEYDVLLQEYVKTLEKLDKVKDRFDELKDKYHELDLQHRSLDTTFQQEVEKEVTLQLEDAVRGAVSVAKMKLEKEHAKEVREMENTIQALTDEREQAVAQALAMKNASLFQRIKGWK